MMRKSIYFLNILIVVLIFALTGCGFGTARIPEVNYWENLDREVISYDGEVYTLSYMALYIAYEEALVEEQALMYEPGEPLKYWNGYANGHFIRVSARDEVLHMALSDIVFCDVGHEMGVVMSTEDVTHAESVFDDFWSDLSDEQRQLMEELHDDMRSVAVSMAYAQKTREYYAAAHDVTAEDLDKDDNELYQELLASHDINVDETLMKGIGFGKVTLIR